MKNISFVVPCYNSQEYMRKCIDSLLLGGENVEIIIVNDGSTDNTGKIADEYVKDYPDIVKAIQKENGGHGSGVNAGLDMATGKYFKVVDSDDWLDEKEILKFMNKLNEFCNISEESKIPDLIVCNYIYDHFYEGTTQVMKYKNVFPENKMCNWNEIGKFKPSQYLVMHSIFFRTDILKQSGVILPEHTFYVDNLFSYKPLPLVKNIFYMNIDLYHYFLGRDDQSVNEKVLIQRIDQQIKVTKLVADSVDLYEVEKEYPKLAVYMRRNISIMMTISSIHLLLMKNQEGLKKRKELWEFIKRRDKRLYKKLRYNTLSGCTYLPGYIGRKITIAGYKTAKKMYKFN